MTAKELRNEIVNRLWSYGNLPNNIQTLMTDNEVDFVMEVIKTQVQEQLALCSVVGQSELLLSYHRFLQEYLSLDLNEIWVKEYLKDSSCG